MSFERFEFDRTSIGAWITWILHDPEKLRNSYCFLKLDRNIFPYSDFHIDPFSKAPIFKPLSSALVQVSPLSAAAYSGKEEAVKTLLRFPNPHNDNLWMSPLALACLSGHRNIIDILIEANAAHDGDDKVSTVMHIAARKGLGGYIHDLRKIYGFTADVEDVNGTPPAIHVLYRPNDNEVKELFSYFLQQGAQTTLFGWKYNWTYADFARAMGKGEALVNWPEDKCGNSSIEGRP
ncbi:hypothetical protein FLAG1_10158 [Fusarium langsethiae]|uniref:Uncharacterized protein n=2 Tax=Fusarium sambucinum species complex TaxID=569360 RepID=A0A0M9EPP2_FUSLA|nr:hypothetical protein FLAG1_10158 [Fusarium langsethiae]OBS20618.1 hypothetical protein FPOA_06967 [Fusarium poae]GKU07976.1 unnamed protein product [Fusarium langsethiae]